MVTIGFKIAPRVVEISHQLLRNVVIEGDWVIDATAGNGNDTLFLAELVGDSGRVFAFDIQKAAIEESIRRLTEAGLSHRVEFICAGHENLDNYIGDRVKAVIFNLGYLPGRNSGIITNPDTTLEALKKAVMLLLPGGVVCLVIYWGHPGGSKEKDAVEDYVSKIPQGKFDVVKISFPNRNTAPYVIGIQKRFVEEDNQNESCQAKKN